MGQNLGLRAGEWVEVKSKDEILETLNEKGQLEGLPFMPEMFLYCGQRFRVFKRAHKTCDPPNGMGGRRMRSAVHLEDARCDGQAHGGCQAGCLIFWKEQWLEKVNNMDESSLPSTVVIPCLQANSLSGGKANRCSEREVEAGTRVSQDEARSQELTYICQSTQLSYATQPLPWWDLRQYIEDYTSGNVRLSQVLAALLFTVYKTVAEAGIGLGSPMLWAYDCFQRIRGGTPYPSRGGAVPEGVQTPAVKLDLQPGEFVRVRNYPDILATLNETWHNKGMYFDSEEVPYCGGTYEVLRRVEKIIDEKTGRMLNLKSDAIILKDVVCQARYSRCRRFCPRSIYPFWREIWLERVADEAGESIGRKSRMRGVAVGGRSLERANRPSGLA